MWHMRMEAIFMLNIPDKSAVSISPADVHLAPRGGESSQELQTGEALIRV